jgi:hypothetical protein
MLAFIPIEMSIPTGYNFPAFAYSRRRGSRRREKKAIE